jgi:hypothetical protein
LKNLITEIEATIDKTPATQVVIQTEQQAIDAAETLKKEKAAKADIEAKLDPYAKLLSGAHRVVTGKRGEYVGYITPRVKALEAGIVDWTNERERIEREEQEAREAAARKEDEERRLQEADTLTERAKAEGRPDLAERAEQILSEPAREVSVSTGGGMARTGSGRAVVAKGVAVGKEVQIEIVDDEALILAFARPFIYREVARWLRSEFKAKGEKLAATLDAKAGECPQITQAVLEVSASKVKAAAKAANGKINWPGVSVTMGGKVNTRTK